MFKTGWSGLLTAVAGERGLLRATADVTPGLEQAGGEVRGCWKGGDVHGDEVGWRVCCPTGLDFDASELLLSCLEAPGFCWGGGSTVLTGEA